MQRDKLCIEADAAMDVKESLVAIELGSHTPPVNHPCVPIGLDFNLWIVQRWWQPVAETLENSSSSPLLCGTVPVGQRPGKARVARFPAKGWLHRDVASAMHAMLVLVASVRRIIHSASFAFAEMHERVDI